MINLRKGGGIHAFLGRLTAEAAPVPGIAELTLLRVDREGGSLILHSLFSVPVGPYDPDQRLFGCRGNLPPEELPAITEIPVASFGALRSVNAVSRDDHRVHLDGFPPSRWQAMPCERAIIKEEGKSFLSGESPSPLQMPLRPSSIWKVVLARFQKNYFLYWLIKSLLTRRPLTAFSLPSRETQKASMRCQPILHFSFSLPMEGGPLFLPYLERLQTLYPGPTPGVLHLRLRVRKIGILILN